MSAHKFKIGDTVFVKAIDSLLYAGNNLSKAQEVFANAIKYEPRIRITIRQRTRVLQRWPQQKWRG